jgi:hypothetical protein
MGARQTTDTSRRFAEGTCTLAGDIPITTTRMSLLALLTFDDDGPVLALLTFDDGRGRGAVASLSRFFVEGSLTKSGSASSCLGRRQRQPADQNKEERQREETRVNHLASYLAREVDGTSEAIVLAWQCRRRLFQK